MGKSEPNDVLKVDNCLYHTHAGPSAIQDEYALAIENSHQRILKTSLEGPVIILCAPV